MYMAPLGKPVLPEVYRIIASRWSGLAGVRRAPAAAAAAFQASRRTSRWSPPCRLGGQLRPGPLHVFAMVVDLGSVVEDHQALQRRAAQSCVDGQVEIACAGGDYPRLDLGDDRL